MLYKTDRRGQALVEWLVLFPLYAFWMVGVVMYGEWFLIHQNLLSAAREGAMLYSSGHMEKEMVAAYIKRALANGFPKMTLPDENIYIGRDSVAFAAYQLDRVRLTYCSANQSFFHKIFNDPLEESCVIRHAPAYWNLTLIADGPPVSW